VTSLKVDADVTLYAIWEEGEAPAPKNHFIVVKASDMVDHEWDTQFWLVTNTPFETGASYEVSMKVKAIKSTEGKAIGTQTHAAPSYYSHNEAIGSIAFTTEWEEYKATGNFSDNAELTWTDDSGNKVALAGTNFSIALNLNDFNPANTYCFDDISLKVNDTEVIKNGDLEGTDFKSFYIKEYPGDPVEATAANVIADGDEIPGSEVVVEKVKITFDLDGGQGTESLEVVKDKEVKVDNPTKENFKFKGWATEKGGDAIDLTTYKATADATLYAIWEEKVAGEVEVIAEAKDFTAVAWVPDGAKEKITFEDGVIVVSNPEATENFWDLQYNVIGGFETKAGVETKVTIRVKGSAAGSLHYKVGNWSNGKTGTVDFTADWSDVVIEGTDFIDEANAFLMLQHGDFVGTVYIESVKIEQK
jgi:uncharacterized repeat protein (TIGR02543 family)